MIDEIYAPEGLPEGIAGDSNTGTIDNLIAALGTANEPYRPDGLGEQYSDKSNTQVIDGLLTENAGFRDAQSKFEKAPEDISGYAFEPVEGVQQYFPKMEEGQSDPRIEIASTAALKAGINSTQFNVFMNEVYGNIAGNDDFPKPDQEIVVMDKVDQAAIYQEFGRSENLGDDAAVSKRVDELSAFGEAYVKQNKLPEGSEVEIEVLSQTAGGLALLAKFQSDLKERGISPGGDGQDAGGMTDEGFAKLGGQADIGADDRKKYNDEVERRRRAKLSNQGG